MDRVRVALRVQVADGQGGTSAPSLFVAAKTVRQAASRAATSTMTSPVESSCNPVWNELLSLPYQESRMPRVSRV